MLNLMDSLTCLPITQNKKKLYSRGCVIVCASSISGEKFPPLLKYSTREQGQFTRTSFLCIIFLYRVAHVQRRVFGRLLPSLKIRKM